MATREDVARLAGVSGATVARVFSNSSNVSVKTTAKVLDAARFLEYAPNFYGRALRGKSPKQLLVYSPELFNPFFVQVFYGIDDYARERGYQVSLTRNFSRSDIQQRRFEGVVCCIYDPNEFLKEAQFLDQHGVPFAFLNSRTSAFDSEDGSQVGFQHGSAVDMNWEQGAYILTDYLRLLGHEEMLMIVDTAKLEGDKKWCGARECAEEKGLRLTPMNLEPLPGKIENPYEYGYLMSYRISRVRPLPTAVICCSDPIAIGLICGLVQQRIRVPEDISVAGFDDSLQSAYANPPLTTVHSPKYQIGQMLAQTLIATLRNEDVSPLPLEPRLIIRQSTAPKRSKDVFIP